MTENYPILHVKSGVYPEMLYSTISDVALQFISENCVSNFNVRRTPSVDHLQRRLNWMKSGAGQESFGTIDDKLPYLAGYNKNTLPLMISDPNADSGALQVIGHQLVFLSRGLPLHQHRDGYLFALTDDGFYTATGFTEVVQEFLEKGYSLVV